MLEPNTELAMRLLKWLSVLLGGMTVAVVVWIIFLIVLSLALGKGNGLF